MKTCPVCQHVAFDDALVCYGCLHRFEEQEAHPEEVTGAGLPERRAPGKGKPHPAAPTFMIKFTPTMEAAGGISWSCAVEAAS